MQTYVKFGIGLVCLAIIAIFTGETLAADSQVSNPLLQDANVVKSVKAEVLSSRDKNSRVWEITKQEEVLDPITGEANLVEVKSYIREKGCGICYKDTQGNWQVTDTSWKNTATGFVIDKANYGLSIGKTAGDMLNYHIDGKVMKLRPVSISVQDGNSAVEFANIDISVGAVIDADRPNVLVFADAFGKGIDLEIQALPDGYHQNVIFKEKPNFGDKTNAKVLVKTEIDTDGYVKSSSDQIDVQVRQPKTGDKVSSTIQNISLAEISSTTLSKDDIEFVQTDSQTGESFISHRFVKSEILHNRDGRNTGLAVADKQLVCQNDGKSYLIESLDANTLERASYPVVWDYHTVNSTIDSNEVWYADTTYYVSSSITLDPDVTLKIEPGTIVKFKAEYFNSINARNGTLIAKGEPYSYIVFTSARDPNMGEIIDQNSVAACDYGGLKLSNSSTIEFCKFGYSELAASYEATQAGNLIFKNNIIFNAVSGVQIWAHANAKGTVSVCNNLFDNLSSNCIYVEYYWPNGDVNDVNIIVASNTTKGSGVYSRGITLQNVANKPAQIKNNILAGLGTGIINSYGQMAEYNNAFYDCNSPVYNQSPDSTDVVLSVSPFDNSATQLGKYFLNTDPNGGELLKDAGYGNVGDYYDDSNAWSIYSVSDANHLFTAATTFTTDKTWQPNYATCDSGTVAIGYHHPRVDYVATADVTSNSDVTFTIMPGNIISMGSDTGTAGSIIANGKLVCDGKPDFENGRIRFMHRGLCSAGWAKNQLRASSKPEVSFDFFNTSQSSVTFSGFYGLGTGLFGGTNLLLQHDNIFKWNSTGFCTCFINSVVNSLFIENGIGQYLMYGAEAINNTYDRNVTWGIRSYSYGSPAAEVSNCLFTNMTRTTGNYSTASCGINDYRMTGNSGPIENYNVFYNNNYHYVFGMGTCELSELSNSDFASMPDCNSATLLTGEPYYTDWTDFAGRFYLLQDSQLIDAGDPCDSLMSGYTTDPNKLVLDTNRRDIGYHYPTDSQSDVDGLYDYQEYWMGTNPSSVDTDGDGLVDGYSGLVSTSQYLAGVDRNGDGYVDGELTLGTKPDSNDTDNDGLPDGWEVHYGLDPAVNDAKSDPDNDGKTNLEEYQASSNPNMVSRLVPSDYSTIQGAINASSNGDEIVVAEGHYYEKINFNGKRIWLRSTDPNDATVASATIIDVNNTASGNYGVTFNNAEDNNSILDGFTIQRGYDGIYCGNNNAICPQIKNCIIKNNQHHGVNCNSASPKFYHSQIITNKSWGIWTGSSGSATFKNCVIAKNFEYGIFTNTGYKITAENCTIYSHSKAGINCRNATIKNSILWNNVDDLLNCSATYSCIEDIDVGTGNIHSNPQFINADANDFRLQYGSLCIDAGDSNSEHTLEPNGGGTAIDIGAYGNTSNATNCYDGDNDGLADAWELQYFGGVDPNAIDPNNDADGDGLRNKDEYHIGWDPNTSNAAKIKGFVTNQQLGYVYPSIQKAIDFANNGQVLIAEPNHFYEAITFNGKAITLRSTDPNDANIVAATIVDANSATLYVFKFNTSESRSSIIEGITVRKASSYAIYCENSSPTIKKCVTKDSYYGAYMNCTSSSYTANPYFEKCIFTGNSYGVNCSSYSTPIFYRCQFLSNSQYGAYIGSSKHITIESCIAKGNGKTNYSYAGIYVGSGSHVTILNCTIVDNAKWGIAASNANVDVAIKNSIVWHTSVSDDLMNCLATYSCIKDGDAGMGNIHPTDPGFVNINSDYHLASTSVCIDAGEPWADYSDEPSPNGGRVDMGAYGNTAEATCTIDDNNDGLADSWQTYHWSDYDPNDPNFGPDGDYDNDGFRNFSEYLYGYDPNAITAESIGIMYVQSSPAMFNPAVGEQVDVKYWVNKSCNATVDIINTVSSQTVKQFVANASGGLNEITWDGKDEDNLIAEPNIYKVYITITSDGITDIDESLRATLYYNHDITNVNCDPFRMLPLNNEITNITYDLRESSALVVRIYDPDGELFRTFTIDEGYLGDIIWDGKGNGPDSKYIFKEGLYRVEIQLQGMHEKAEATVRLHK